MITATTPVITGSHPYADKFPMMSADAFAELIESVRANGLRYPVVATPDGQILDGRNRYAACLELGIEPDIEIYDGDDLAEYVIDCNSSRRHMSTGARAMATALVLAADGRRENGRWKRDSVQIGNGLESTSGWIKALNRAGRVLDYAPDLAERVRDDTIELTVAAQEAQSRRDAEQQDLAHQERIAAEETDAKAFVTDAAPDLAAQVGPDQPYQTYAEARAIWEQRNREEAARLAKEKARLEADARAEHENKVQEAQEIARSLLTLSGARFAEWRKRNKADFPTVADYVPPTARALHEPDAIRQIIRDLATYADELEQP